ncbi:tRNA 5-methoxyuridine(34)/uridine 5-oxyacetic acid(34) synthase CmoB [Marinicella sediminis]|uniref:tRNA U34 carboxymethyltransferase n=1 Tax=Marinicella sediminis TaxID=1792834 RepID=A0ABV7J6E1_9GAMM|nr:tRNA 5-methoxyuridine(34)/uridine 5-oxyacetic acid(34) synthase CmoB [Marinicella sediminis]
MFQEKLNLFLQAAVGTALEEQAAVIRSVTEQVIANINQGDLPRWQDAHQSLPDLSPATVDPDQGPLTVRFSRPLSVEQQHNLEAGLRALHPWRKGPFKLAECFVDAEWRSDFKWNRLANALPDLNHKTVLDVGCGNGYYLMKMAALNPGLLLGIEPGLLHNVQFWSVEKYANTGAHILPLKIQDLPQHMACFDVVLSMGVLYHRKSPIAHIEHLRSLLPRGGTLILETLIIDGDEQTCLVPQGRYAQMRNVWFLPSVAMLTNWLAKLGMRHIEVIDVSLTTTAEQRSTDWMRFHSLPQFLTADEQHTVEGHPPPKRVLIRCQH